MSKIKRSQVLVGSDPEIFLVDAKTGAPVSGVGLVGAKKGDPKSLGTVAGMGETENVHLQGLGEYLLHVGEIDPSKDVGGVVEDNVMIELNPAPCRRPGAFVARHLYMMVSLQKNVLTPRGLRAVASSYMDMPDNQLTTPDAMEFGCMPDMCVYTGGERTTPSPDTLGNRRFAGGHVHIGYDIAASKLSPEDVVVLCDILLGLPAVIFNRDTERYKVYGQAGCYRIKPYGIEYRTLSNYWLNSVAAAANVAHIAIDVAHIAQRTPVEEVYEFMNECDVMLVKEAIETANVQLATELCARIGQNARQRSLLTLPEPLSGRFVGGVLVPAYFGQKYDKLSFMDV